MTPAATRLLAWLARERAFWAEAAEDPDANQFLRHGAVSRRDQLDMLLQRMPRELEAVEREAARLTIADVERLDSIIEGVPV